MQFGHLTEYSKSNIVFENLVENEVKRLVPDFFLFFKKVLYVVKASGV